MSVFVDASVLVGGAVARDRHHEAATALIARIAGDTAFSTDHVLVEAWHLIERRAGRHHAMRFWFGIRDAPLFVECVTRADLDRAEAIARAWADHDFDLVDCTSFAVMERLGCTRAATFDRDFAVYRYGVDRTKAFEILN